MKQLKAEAKDTAINFLNTLDRAYIFDLSDQIYNKLEKFKVLESEKSTLIAF